MKTVITLTKVFFKGHPKAGEETRFADLVKTGGKIHTCRDNADYWMKKIDMLKATGGTLCIREWSDRPYRSPQNTIVEIPAERVHVSKLFLFRYRAIVFDDTHTSYNVVTTYKARVNGKDVDIAKLARNDGFDNVDNFTAFLDPLFDKYKLRNKDMYGKMRYIIRLAIIHFNEFNY